MTSDPSSPSRSICLKALISRRFLDVSVICGSPCPPALRPLACHSAALLGDFTPGEELLAAPLDNLLSICHPLDLAGLLIIFSRYKEAENILLTNDYLVESPLEESLVSSRLGIISLHSCDQTSARDHYLKAYETYPHLFHLCNLARLTIDEYLSQTTPSSVLGSKLSEIYSSFDSFKVPGTYNDLVRSLRYEIIAVISQDGEADRELAEKFTLGSPDFLPSLLSWADALCRVSRHEDALGILRDWSLRNASTQPSLYASCITKSADINASLARFPRSLMLYERALFSEQQQTPEHLSTIFKAFTAALQSGALERCQFLINKADAVIKRHPDLYSDLSSRHNIDTYRAQLADEKGDSKALDLFQKVLDDNPWDLPSLLGLGHAHLRRGDLKEAERCFRKVYIVDPTAGFSALSSTNFFKGESLTKEDILPLESLSRTPSPEGSLNASFLYNVARGWESCGDYDRAFACAHDASEVLKKGVNYDPDLHRQYVIRLLSTFEPNFSEASMDRRTSFPAWPSSAARPLFIVGMPRSGTTLVEQFLSAHSNIYAGGEQGVIPRTIASLEKLQRLQGTGRHYPEMLDDLTGKDFHDLALKVQENYATLLPPRSTGYITDKLPHNFENVGFIKLLFPAAKIIWCRRDSRDVAVSNYMTNFHARNGGLGYSYDLAWTARHIVDSKVLHRHWRARYPDDIITIDYEDLTSEPAAQLKPLMDQLGLPWQEALLDHRSASDRQIRTASIAQVRAPLNRSSVGRWRHYDRNLSSFYENTNISFSATLPGECLIRLPEPGLLGKGTDIFHSVLHQRDMPLTRFDEAEVCFKKLLKHIPGHASATFMLGLVYVEKGHLKEGLDLMRSASARCPNNKNWYRDVALLEMKLGMKRSEISLEPINDQKKGDHQ